MEIVSLSNKGQPYWIPLDEYTPSSFDKDVFIIDVDCYYNQFGVLSVKKDGEEHELEQALFMGIIQEKGHRPYAPKEEKRK